MTGVEFHNSSTQTIPKIRVPSSVEKFHRDTQIRLTNIEPECSKQRIQHQHKWYTMSLRKLAVKLSVKYAVLHFILFYSIFRPKMDVMYQMSQRKY